MVVTATRRRLVDSTAPRVTAFAAVVRGLIGR
jgi:hypothetical protein